MTDKKPEILAPAGAAEQLEASVRAGADAVYLGAGRLNARQAAANFNGSQLDDAVTYCHERGVRVYLAMNTLLFDGEFEEAEALLKQACRLPVDAIIVQDAGVAAMIRRCAPEMPIHASTQMTVHNPAALSVLKDMGFCRAILAREMSASEIAELRRASDMELEAFVHGALCMSVSGQCYLSAMLGSRSGNRGRCAQPCRLPFRSGDFENCLSLKDMSHIGSIDELTACGVSSLKIEGRLKRPEYCAAAVSACRMARDEGAVPPELSQKLEAVFSRSGFTDGYIKGVRGRAMFGSRTKEDVTAGSGVLSSLHGLYKNEYQRVPLHMVFKAEKNFPVQLTVRDNDGHVCTVNGGVPDIAEGRGIDRDSTAARLSKTGGTPYYVETIECEVGEGLSMPASAINSLRRDAVERLAAERRVGRPIKFTEFQAESEPHKPERQEYHAVFSSIEQVPENLPDKLSRIYIPLETPAEQMERLQKTCSQRGVELAVECPRGIFGTEQQMRKLMGSAAEAGIRLCMIHNIGLIRPAAEAGLAAVGGFGMNITNSHALAEYERLGLCGAELSMELTVSRIEKLGGRLQRGVMIYGYQPLMLTRNCPAAVGKGCSRSEGCSITDRRGESFPVKCRMGCSEVFNTIPLSIVEKTAQFPTVDWFLMRFTVENSVETEEILFRAVRKIPESKNRFTRGLFYRGVE